MWDNASVSQIGLQQIDAVLKFLPLFESQDFIPGEWIEKQGFFPHFSYSPEVLAFIRALYEQNFVLTFDWFNWSETATKYQENPQALNSADLLTLRKLLTAHVRADRFTEGHLAAVLQSGHIVAILKRVRQLRNGKAE